MKPRAFKKSDFIDRFRSRAGLDCITAEKAYDAMVSVFSDAISTGGKMTVGDVMTIAPVRRPPRKVNVGFNKGQDGAPSTVFISARTDFKVRVFDSFADKHEIGAEKQ